MMLNQLLRLCREPGGFGALIGGLAAILTLLFLGVGTINSSTRTITLNCYRVEPTQIDCKLKDFSLLQSIVQKIDNLKGARIDKYTSSATDGEGNIVGEHTFYNVVLLTSRGDVPLPTNYQSSEDTETKPATAFRINAFIANPQEASLTIQEGPNWGWSVFGCIFLAFGLSPIVLLIVLKRQRAVTTKQGQTRSQS